MKSDKQMHLFVRPDSESKSGMLFFLVPDHMRYWTSSSDVRIGQTEVLFDIPDDLSEDQLREKAIETFRDKQKEIRAQAHKEVIELEEKIRELQLLTFVPEPPEKNDE